MHITTRYVRRSPHPAEITAVPGLKQSVNFARALAHVDEPTLGCPAAVKINGVWFTRATGLDDVLDAEWKDARP